MSFKSWLVCFSKSTNNYALSGQESVKSLSFFSGKMCYDFISKYNCSKNPLRKFYSSWRHLTSFTCMHFLNHSSKNMVCETREKICTNILLFRSIGKCKLAKTAYILSFILTWLWKKILYNFRFIFNIFS